MGKWSSSAFYGWMNKGWSPGGAAEPIWSSKSLEFDGDNEWVAVDDDDSLDITSNLSLSVWFKTSAGGIPVSKTTTTGSQRQYFVNVNAGSINAYFYKDGAGSNYNGKATDDDTFDDGAWHHVVATYDSSNNNLIYVDGSLEDTSDVSAGTPDGTIAAGTGEFTIGATGTGTGDFTGFIDEVAVFDTAVLTADDVTAIYNSGKPVDISTLSLTATLVSYWYMGDSDDSITTIKDRVASNDGTPTNMASDDIVADAP